MNDRQVVVGIGGHEWYPVWVLSGPDEDNVDWEYVVPESLVKRTTAAAEEFHACQRQLKAIVDPPCPDCGHHASRHQVVTTANHRYDLGSTYCLHRDYTDAGSTGCRCTTPTPPNPNRRDE